MRANTRTRLVSPSDSEGDLEVENELPPRTKKKSAARHERDMPNPANILSSSATPTWKKSSRQKEADQIQEETAQQKLERINKENAKLKRTLAKVTKKKTRETASHQADTPAGFEDDNGHSKSDSDKDSDVESELEYLDEEPLPSRIEDRAPHAQGNLRNKLLPLISKTFGFKKDTSRPAVVESNKTIYRMLQECTPKRLTYTDPEKRSGYAQATFLLEALQEACFKSKKDIGVVFADYFNPLPLPLMALLLTMVEFGVDGWSSGQYVAVDSGFSEKDYAAKYAAHLKQLKDWESVSVSKVKKIRSRMYNTLLMGSIKQDVHEPEGFSEEARRLAEAEMAGIPDSEEEEEEDAM
ncbi:hypothetical protein PHLCEN_2v3247 [Hermanssonia centrifuga]|uniref:DUF6532 domain-containing protein n=1 Tax=Hermanssonia centrifuga TaxID=98765 RepID=A0A2R6QXI5_9APHY|nr:hypothetical protein PHLCEN_2v3247 [Hermanssonia centrifuga]